MIRGYWWKIGGALLILYSLIAGLAIPLNSGIVDVSPRQVEEDKILQLEYKTYNINYDHLDDVSKLRAWLKIDDERVLKAEEAELLSPSTARVQFTIPNLDFGEKEVLTASLIISDPVHAYAVLPSAVFIKRSEDTTALKATQFVEISDIDEIEGIHFPFRNILVESIRNTYYHVPLWFAMVVLFAISAFYSGKYLSSKNIKYDKEAAAFCEVGTLFGILGFFTGAIWARYTWGAFWSWDIKQVTAAVALLIYLAYFILRSSVEDHDKRARFTAAYNLFAFIMLIPLIFVIPRMTDSLHPGSGGNPAMGGEDLDNTMRMIFYPAVIGWILIGYWISTLRGRINKLKYESEATY